MLRDSFGCPYRHHRHRVLMSEEDGLFWMVLIHTHIIELCYPLLLDRPNVTELAASTERHAAEVMAALWRNRKRADRASSAFWWNQYQMRGAYQCVEDIPSNELYRLEQLRDQLATDPRIAAVVAED